MATDSSASDADEDRSVRRHRYRRLLALIHANCGDPQHVMITAQGPWTIVKHSNISVREAQSSLRAARENDHVVRCRDGSGKWRYALTGDAVDELPNRESLPYGPDDVDAFRDIIETEAAAQDPDQDVIGWCNTRLQEIDEQQDGDDDV